MLGATAMMWLVAAFLALAVVVGHFRKAPVFVFGVGAAFSVVAALMVEFVPFTEPGAVSAVIYSREQFAHYKTEALRKQQDVLEERWVSSVAKISRFVCPNQKKWATLTQEDRERWHRYHRSKNHSRDLNDETNCYITSNAPTGRFSLLDNVRSGGYSWSI